MRCANTDPEMNLEKLERDLWDAADNLRANSKLTTAQYAMPVLGLIFLRHAHNRFLAVQAEVEPALPKQTQRQAARTGPRRRFRQELRVLPQQVRPDGRAGRRRILHAALARATYRQHHRTPDRGTVFDPACGPGSMFVQTGHFIELQRHANTSPGFSTDHPAWLRMKSAVLKNWASSLSRNAGSTPMPSIASTMQATH